MSTMGSAQFTDESFQTYVNSALKYESQQRIWLDFNGKPIASMGFDQKGKGKDKKGKEKDKGGKEKGSSSKGKGVGSETRTCFHCNERGHLAVDCPKKKGKGDFERNPKGDQKGKGGKGKEKKGEKGDKGWKGGKPKGKEPPSFHHHISLSRKLAARFGQNPM